MMKGLTFAHISDLHLSHLHRRDNIRRTKRLLEHLARRSVDHLIVTGDITADADPRDFQIARSLFAGTGWLAPEKLSVVVGNHDIFGGVHVAEDILAFPGRCRATDYLEKLNLFRETFREAFDGALIPSPRAGFPFAKAFGKVLLVGLNSVSRYARVKNPIGSNGKVDAKQFEDTTEILESRLFEKMRKVVLIHHHFNKHAAVGEGAAYSLWGSLEKQTMKLRGKKDLIRLFRRTKVDLVVHGHLHASADYVRGGVRFVNSGASVMNDSELAAFANLIELTDERIHVSLATPIGTMHPLIQRPEPLEQAALSSSEAA